MKKNIHPRYRKVLFVDSSTGYKFVCGSSVETTKTEVFEGVEYPAFYVSVSSASHPFFTGSHKFLDTEGRVDKFLKRYATVQQKQASQAAAQAEAKSVLPSKSKRR